MTLLITAAALLSIELLDMTLFFIGSTTVLSPHSQLAAFMQNVFYAYIDLWVSAMRVCSLGVHVIIVVIFVLFTHTIKLDKIMQVNIDKQMFAAWHMQAVTVASWQLFGLFFGSSRLVNLIGSSTVGFMYATVLDIPSDVADHGLLVASICMIMPVALFIMLEVAICLYARGLFSKFLLSFAALGVFGALNLVLRNQIFELYAMLTGHVDWHIAMAACVTAVGGMTILGYKVLEDFAQECSLRIYQQGGGGIKDASVI